MNTIARLAVERTTQAWLLILVLAAGIGSGVALFFERQQQQERLGLMQNEVERRSAAIMSQTLDGNVMGALSLLGIIDPELKREARGQITGQARGERLVETKGGKMIPVSEANIAIMESIGRSFDTEGAFLATEQGLIGSAWYSNGKPSFGSNIKFRPYYQMAMQGIENIYAAVGTGQGERILYFSVPVYAKNTKPTDVVGAVVARVGLLKVDNLLRDKADIALLLSPQQVVFASSRPDWMYRLSGTATPERINAIRDIKQFGDMFADKTPAPLPFVLKDGVGDIEGKPHAIASAKVKWNDPLGDWTLVMMEDLTRTVPAATRALTGGVTSVLVLLLAGLMLHILRGHHSQVMAARQLDAFAQQQQANAKRKTAIAAAALHLQQAKSLDELGQSYLAELHDLLGILQGVAYVVTEDNALQLAGSYACAVPPAPTLRRGDGLLGQCAIEKRLMRLDAPEEEGAWRIRSGLGNILPRTLLMAPVMLNEALLGVTEVALITEADAATEETLTEMNKLLALNLEILRRSTRDEDDRLHLVRLNWHPSYESGNAEIDRDHRTLFAIANDLLNAIVARRSHEEIGHIIDALVQETTAHFAREEAIQIALGYPDVEAHVRIHHELLAETRQLVEAFHAGDLAAGPFFQFLAYDLVARHFLKEDRKFFPHLAEPQAITAEQGAQS